MSDEKDRNLKQSLELDLGGSNKFCDFESATNKLKPNISDGAVNMSDSNDLEKLIMPQSSEDFLKSEESKIINPISNYCDNGDIDSDSKITASRSNSKNEESDCERSPNCISQFINKCESKCQNVDERIEKDQVIGVEQKCLTTEDFCSNVNSDVSHESVLNETFVSDGSKEECPVIVCSTPNVGKNAESELDQSGDRSMLSSDFGKISPLNVNVLRGKQNLKRKFVELQPIVEVDEDSDELTSSRKQRIIEQSNQISKSNSNLEGNISSTPCFEAPAKSLLKKWQPSCLSRNSSSFVVLDECGESDIEECSKLKKDCDNNSKADDFEIACQSLTEELMKNSSNIETLEKYHSQVQLESQMDDEKFVEVLQELTQNFDLDDNTYFSLQPNEEKVPSETNISSHSFKVINNSIASSPSKDNFEIRCSLSENNKSFIKNTENSGVVELDSKVVKKIKEEKTDNSFIKSEPGTKCEKGHPTTDVKEENVDEEDILLEEDQGSNEKPYEFFEFVSSDPKENEDNYNPEWQKLGKLTSDEERYKAVRDRWRSLVPPDPNKNLTFRQWRLRNKKPPITTSTLNNNHLVDDKEKSQLCTAVFENKIRDTVQDLEYSRMKIFRQRNSDFEKLALIQDEEQRIMVMRGGNCVDLALLHKRHIEECRRLKNQHDQELKRITDVTEERIRILREASNEVLLFQKFYEGMGANKEDKVCMYLTDTQVQELMETEEMLEQYRQFYQ